MQLPVNVSDVMVRAEPGFRVETSGSETHITAFGRDALLSLAEDADAVAVLLGRLTYRGELASRIGADRLSDDGALLLSTYRHGGAVALERLEGDFAAVVVDRRAGRIEAVRDPMGAYPLYWKEMPSGLVLATSLRLLPDATAFEPDPDFISETLSLAVGEIDYFAGTAFKGVTRLRAGERLTVAVGRKDAQTSRFWTWAEQVERPKSDRLEEVAAEYRERLRHAVRERLQGRVAAHVSGGMDSSAVALLAAPVMAERGSPLIGISMVYDAVENLRVERPFIDEVYAAQPGIEAHRLRADDHLDFDGFADCPPHEEPYSGLFRIGLSRAGIEAAAGAGAQTLLTGFGADEVLSNAPYYIADLLRAGRIPEAWREAGRWSRARSCTIWRYLWPFGIAPLVASPMLSGWRSWLRGGYADWEHQSQSTIAPFVQRDFAARTGLHKRMLTHVQANFRTQPTVVLSEALARLRSTSGDWMRQNLARPLGLHISHPFRDPRVMRLGLGARLAIRPDPGQQKPLLSAAMQGIVPDAILRRRAKTHFNAVFFKGLALNLPMLDALAADAANDPLGIFDRAELRRCLHRAALGVASVDAMVGLNNALGLLRWFSLLPEWRAAEPLPARIVTVRHSRSAG